MRIPGARMRIPGADKTIDNLIKWSANEEWNPFREQVFAEHFDMIFDRFDTTKEEIADLLGDSFGMVFGCVLEDFFTARFGDKGDNIIDDYLKRRGWQEKISAKRYLEAIRDSVLSLYEVVDLDPGHSMTVRDLVLGGDTITVEEKLGSETAARWDRIAGRIVTVNKKVYFTGSLLLFPHEVADEILSGIEEMVKSIKKKLQREAKKQGEPADFKDRDLREMFLPCLSGYHPHPLYVVCLLGLQARAGAGALRRRSGRFLIVLKTEPEFNSRHVLNIGGRNGGDQGKNEETHGQTGSC